MAEKMSVQEKEHYAEVMFNKSFSNLTDDEKVQIENYYEQESQYIASMTSYEESGISKGVKRLFI